MRRPPQRSGFEVENPFKLAAHTDGPIHWADVKLQLISDLIEQREAVAALAVNLVDEGNDRDGAQAADLKQFARLRLNPARCVDHHHRTVNGGERAIGIFGKILMPRRIEQIEGEAVSLKCHHRGCHRNPALLLNLHPVGAGTPIDAARLNLTCGMNCPAEQKQFFCERRFPGIRMRNDGKGAPIGAVGWSKCHS